jgi:hypothetical protein|tara:strand:- start:74 stop:271 length:198 start_codon:yes stop_codon:yes gene_type:complete
MNYYLPLRIKMGRNTRDIIDTSGEKRHMPLSLPESIQGIGQFHPIGGGGETVFNRHWTVKGSRVP